MLLLLILGCEPPPPMYCDPIPDEDYPEDMKCPTLYYCAYQPGRPWWQAAYEEAGHWVTLDQALKYECEEQP